MFLCIAVFDYMKSRFYLVVDVEFMITESEVIDIGQTVMVKEGKYSGCKGRVLCYKGDGIYRVIIDEDTSQPKQVQIPRESFEVMNEDSNEVDLKQSQSNKRVRSKKASKDVDAKRKRSEVKTEEGPRGVDEIDSPPRDRLPSCIAATSPARLKTGSYSRSLLESPQQRNRSSKSANTEVEDARNNLYWLEDNSMVCLWYGGGLSAEEEEDGDDGNRRTKNHCIANCLVEVFPLQCFESDRLLRRKLDSELWETDDSLSYCSSLDTLGSLSPHQDAVEGTIPTKKTLFVQRQKLKPLDFDSIEGSRNDLDKDFCKAILDFAEWDEPAKHDYVWPDFVESLMLCSELFCAWRRRIRGHHDVLCRLMGDHRKLYLVALIAQRTGLSLSREDSSFASSKTCSPLSDLSAVHNDAPVADTCDLLEEIIQSALVMKDCSDGTDFTRFTPRFGPSFQAETEESAAECSESSSSNLTTSEESTNERISLVFSPRHRAGNDLKAYLSESRTAALFATSVGNLILANREVNWDQFFADLPLATSITPRSHPSEECLLCQSSLTLVLRRETLPIKSEQNEDFAKSRRNAEMEVEVLLVTDGLQIWWVPLKQCRSLSLPDDVALDILHSKSYSTRKALSAVKSLLANASQQQTSNERLSNGDESSIHLISKSDVGELTRRLQTWDPVHFCILIRLLQKCKKDIRRLWIRFRKELRKWARELHAQRKVSSTTGTPSPKFSFRDVLFIHQLHTQGRKRRTAPATEKMETRPTTIQDSRYKDLFGMLSSELGATDGMHPRNIKVPKRPKKSRRKSENFRLEEQLQAAANSSFASTIAESPFCAPKAMHLQEPRRHMPPRWPSEILPYARHNLYWQRTYNLPCVCTGIDEASLKTPDVLLKVMIVACSAYHHEVSVAPSTLNCFSRDLVRQCPDERSASFALSLKDLFEWETNASPIEWNSCVWYTYPDFVYKFLNHAPTFSAWRKNAERSNRGKNSTHRTIYFEALASDTSCLASEIQYQRWQSGKSYPWDTSIQSVQRKEENSQHGRYLDGSSSEYSEDSDLSSETSSSSSEDDESNSDVPITKRKQKLEVPPESPTTLARKARELEEERQIRLRSPFNLYWLNRASLPCLYYDNVENEMADSFSVLPLCCSTYHYPVKVKLTFSSAVALTPELLKQCTDERTQEFTQALFDFVAFVTASNATSSEFTPATQESTSKRSTSERFQWPEFVKQLVSCPRRWGTWRKTVERNQRGARREAYFQALCRDYHDEPAISPSSED